jgi:CMP-N,N'-diacetyllegionaminic acid synthase
MMEVVKQKILALIPARGGSKGLPNKNILCTAGKPLIGWTIEAALRCDFIDRVVVSTDCDRIAAISSELGAEVPFLRPAPLSSDSAKGVDVVLHAVEKLPGYDVVIVLQPTSPLRTTRDIIDSLAIYASTAAQSCVSVCLSKSHPNWMKRIDSKGLLVPYENCDLVPNRQQLEPVYSLNGAIYISSIPHLLATQSFYSEKTAAYVMPPERSLDIDNAFDHRLCELLLLDRSNAYAEEA